MTSNKLDLLKLWVTEFGGSFVRVGPADDAWFKLPTLWALHLADKANGLGLKAEVYHATMTGPCSYCLVWLS